MKKFNRAEAEALALFLSERYGLETRVLDTEFSKESGLENYSFVGIHQDKLSIVCFDCFEDWQDFKIIAATIVQTDADLILEQHMKEDHIPPHYPQDDVSPLSDEANIAEIDAMIEGLKDPDHQATAQLRRDDGSVEMEFDVLGY
jgi:hypothetical protein